MVRVSGARQGAVKGELVQARMGDSTAAAYADVSAGSSPVLTTSARRILEFEKGNKRTLAALHTSGGCNSAGVALSRYVVQAKALAACCVTGSAK